MIPDNGKLRVIRHDPRREQRVRIFLLVCIALLAGVAYWYGSSHALQNQREAEQRNINLERQATVLQEENNELRQRLAILESSGKMDRDALNIVRLQFKELEDEKERLHKELAFFKSILAPEDRSTGVRIAEFSLLRGKKAGHYRIRLVVSQVARSNPFLRGSLSLSILGKQDGKVVTIPLEQLVSEGQLATRLGFRYFQALPSDKEYLFFTLPKGFQPSEIKVVIQVTSGTKQHFEQIYQWDKELVEDVWQEQDGW